MKPEKESNRETERERERESGCGFFAPGCSRGGELANERWPAGRRILIGGNLSTNPSSFARSPAAIAVPFFLFLVRSSSRGFGVLRCERSSRTDAAFGTGNNNELRTIKY